MALASRTLPSLRPTSALGAPCLLPTRPLRRQCVVKASDGPRSRVTREYRESDDSISVPSAEASQKQQPKDGAIYVDADAAMPRQRPQDNMSKEMKARLRKEYVGLGGAENQAMSSNLFLWISIIVALLAVASKMIGAI